MFYILGANTLSDDYSVDNSLRFNDGETQYLTRTASSEVLTAILTQFHFGSNRQNKMTFREQYIYMGGDQDTDPNNLWIRLQGTEHYI